MGVSGGDADDAAADGDGSINGCCHNLALDVGADNADNDDSEDDEDNADDDDDDDGGGGVACFKKGWTRSPTR